MVVIVDYGMGNLGSIARMLVKIGADVRVSSSAEDILSASRIILPGVGAFDAGMENLQRLGVLSALHARVVEGKTPFLGICLGMQLLAKESQEGTLPGLGWIDARVQRFALPREPGLQVPHMGWDTVTVVKDCALFKGLEQQPRFYFAHSYHLAGAPGEISVGMTSYGYEFVSAFQQENIMGVQFHPEKSHRFGLQLLKNFVGL